ncbi:Ester hydrolase-like protein [Colletotrichum asianum]|uniref:DUF1907 domain-containing protein n=1 Tax=Colletotrichum asianum TaxID=702518 RepID=A0A8H3ZRD7_9PEZI|nr:hypothetical protein GQ607_011792 [Colletotrichum asianum]
MQIQKFQLSPPSLEELAERLRSPLAANFHFSSVTVEACPDLRQAPFHLATRGLSGDERVADIGGQPNLFPRPQLDSFWAMDELAVAMDMNSGSGSGSLIGAGAGPFHIIGQNSELAPNLSWEDGLQTINNQTRIIKIMKTTGGVGVEKSSSLDCGLMANLFGSSGEPGPVLRVVARGRKGVEKSFTECIRKALYSAYGDDHAVSLGGAFVVKSGNAVYHIMPDFPPEHDLPFRDRDQVDAWLTWHKFQAPMVCLSVLHSADPGKLGLRMEHTHCFSAEGNAGGHYHYEADDSAEEVEYEGYFNTAKVIYRIDNPAAV